VGPSKRLIDSKGHSGFGRRFGKFLGSAIRGAPILYRLVLGIAPVGLQARMGHRGWLSE
jgi:hypothetical protein